MTDDREYIALLRGINVGGHQVKMERLRQVFTDLGLTNVRSYIQTGNLFFETEQVDPQALTQTIEARLKEELGYEVPVYLRTVEEVERLLALDPFSTVTVTDDMRCCIVFLADPIPTDLALPLFSSKNDMQILQVTKREAFVIWYLLDGRPPASMTFLEKTLGGKGTTRFHHTTVKILEAAKKR